MRSIGRKSLYTVVILSMVLSLVPRAPAARAASENENREVAPRLALPDPTERVQALLGGDPQTQAINAAIGDLPHDDWQGAMGATPDQGRLPAFELFGLASLDEPEPPRPQIPAPMLGTAAPAAPALPAPARPRISDMAGASALLSEYSHPQPGTGEDVAGDEAAQTEKEDERGLMFRGRSVSSGRRDTRGAGPEEVERDTPPATPPGSSDQSAVRRPAPAGGAPGNFVYLPFVARLGGNGDVIVSPQEGGRVTSPDQDVTVTFQAGGLPGSIAASVKEDVKTSLPAHFVQMGPKVTIQARWLENNRPVTELDPDAQPVMEPGALKPTPSQPQYWATISIRLREGQGGNDRLAIARQALDGAKWEILPTQLDSQQNVAVAETDRFGTFALIENAALWQLDNVRFAAEIGDEFIVDDGDLGFEFHEHDGSVDYFWPSDCAAGGCWNSDAWWTYNRSQYEELPLDQPWNWVTWTPTLSVAGYYYVQAWIPADHATTSGAEYEIHHAGEMYTVSVSQWAVGGMWKNLDAYYFEADGSEHVYLDDVVPEQDEYPHGSWSYVGFDAVRFIYAGQDPPPPADLEPPVIHSADRWLDGNGSTVIRAHVTDNVEVGQVVLVFNGVSVDMNPVGGDIYESVVSVPSSQISQFQIVAVDVWGNVATFPPGSQIDIRGYQSRDLGWYNFACGGNPCDPGTLGNEADPVNTANGNFSHHTTDLTIDGIGDTDIAIERNYNSLPNEPQGVVRYTLDGDALQEEPVDVHPESFGPGWTFLLDISLLVMDNGLLHGVQVRYPDGHTASFTDNGDGTFSPVETRVYDKVTTEGDGYLLKRKDLTGYHFDADGHLTSITDRNDNAITLTYDGDRLTHADNSAGRWVRFEYNGDGLISDIYAPEGVHLQYGYVDGRLHSFTNARGLTTDYECDAEGRLTIIVTPRDHPSLRLGYDDELGRMTEQTVGAAELRTFAYDDDRTTTITDTYGNTTTHVYDEKDRLVESRDALGHSEYYGYNDRDNRTYFKDRAGGEWHYAYDDQGNRLTQDGPLGWHSEFAYNDLDLVTRFVEQVTVTTTRETTFTYDARGNLIEICNPLDDCSTIDYDGRGLPTDLWDFAGSQTSNTYDAEGDLIAATNAESETTRFEHDGLGRMVEMRTPLGNVYTYTYDLNDNLTDVDGPLGYHLGYGYDDNDNLEIEIDPNGGEIRYGYDASDNLVAVVNQLDFTTVYTYGLMNELTGFEDAEGRVWSYGYDALLQMADIHGPLDTHTHFEYDTLGNVTDVTDPEGHVTHTQYDALNRPTTVTLNHRPGEPESADTNVTTAYEYDLLGDILRVVDAEGNPTVYEYDLLGRMTLERDAEEQEWEYEYDPMGTMTHVVNPRRFATFFGYDGVYRLRAITDTLGNLTTFVYDDDGNLIDEVDPLGVVTHYDYDALDHPVQEIRNYRPGEPEDAEVNVTTEYAYDLAGNLRYVTDPRDYQSEFQYDSAHRLTDIFDYEHAHTHFTYDNVDNMRAITDDNDHTTTYIYDGLDRRISVTNAEMHTVELSYDKVGNLTDMVDANGNPTHFEVDALGRVTRMVDALDGEWLYEYDRVGNVLVETDANNHNTTYTYDKVYRLVSAADAEDNTSRFRWDANSDLVEFIDGNGHGTLYGYDELDRLASVSNAEHETTGYQYDPLGNQTHLIEADGAVTLYGYNPLYRLISVTENYVVDGPADKDTNVATSYVYDASGNLSQIINANLAVTAFEHDGMGRLVREVDPLGNTWEYTYDGVGNQLTRRDAKGALTEYSYYPDDQLRQVDYADGTFVEYTYDPNNNRTLMQDSLGTTTWDYDELDRVTDVVDPFGRALHFEYDAVGNRIEMVYPDGNPVAYTYYDNNWLKTMIDPTGRLTFYQYDGVGNITHIINSNSTVTDVTYDDADRVLTLVNRQTTGARKTNSGFDYDYNEMGHVVRVVNEYGWRKPSVVTETYTYDGLHRLAGMQGSDDVVMSYTYDKVGNRLTWETNDDLTTQTPLDGFAATYEYNEANQLITATIESETPNSDVVIRFGYDANGNRTGRLEIGKTGPESGTDYTYDPENRLVEVQDYKLVGGGNRVDGEVTTLGYDGGGRRLVKTYDPNDGGGGQKRVEYVFDGLDPVAEYEMLNGQRDNYYRGALGRIATMHHFPDGTEGQMSWYHYNFKGDVVGLTRHHGQSTHNYRYDPYGGVVPAQGNFTDPHNHYTLTGKEYDEHTGLVYFGARYYDPMATIWLTQDSYRGVNVRPISLHRYAYVRNIPTVYVDPWGFKEAYLTFDDGPNPESTPYILQTLEMGNAKAVFFVTGDNIEGEVGKEILWDIVSSGHKVGNHTYSHPDMIELSRHQVREELERTNQLIREAVSDHRRKARSTGEWDRLPQVTRGYIDWLIDHGPDIWRAPGGDETYSAYLAASELGLTHVGWNVDPEDWRFHNEPLMCKVDDHTITRRIMYGYNNGGIKGLYKQYFYTHRAVHEGDIVLMHDARHSSSAGSEPSGGTASSLHQTLRRLRDVGYDLDTPYDLAVHERLQRQADERAFWEMWHRSNEDAVLYRGY